MSRHSSLFPWITTLNATKTISSNNNPSLIIPRKENRSIKNNNSEDSIDDNRSKKLLLGEKEDDEDVEGGVSSRGGCILLMDEVTASLDANAESLVTEAIMRRVRRGATALLVAHRLSSLQKCDLILVLRDGEVVERGSHAELLKKKGGWYAEAWRLQSTSK